MSKAGFKPKAKHGAKRTKITTDGRKVVAGVTYLNARPLVDELSAAPFSQTFELARATSREVARRLSEDECVVALMPTAAVADFGGIELLPEHCISATGPVRSVLLLSEVPLEKLEHVVLDSTSRTSVVLARLMLLELGHRHIKFSAKSPADAVASVQGTTGAMVIADIALKHADDFAHTADLAELWVKHTGLPFVFAAWGAFPGALSNEEAAAIGKAGRLGLSKRGQLAKSHAQGAGVSVEVAGRYLSEHIHYEFGPKERAGLQLFFDKASEHGLLPPTKVCLRRTGGEEAPFVLGSKSRDLQNILERAAAGKRISGQEAARIYSDAPLFELGMAADAIRKRRYPDGVVTYIVDRNVNYTNVCTTSCRFCAFYRPVGHKEAYVLSREVLAQKLQEVVDAGGVQILLQGGLNPELPLTWYEDLFQWMKREFKLGLHALSPEEILFLSEKEDLPVRTILERLHAAGLDSLPGGGAEILTDRVRRKIAKAKCTSEEWLGVMRHAHQMGLRSSATMMYGTTDNRWDRVAHLLKLRNLQDETGGFTAFFCWDYQYEQGVVQKAGETGAAYYLRTQALSRLVLDNFDHVGASWVTQGPDVGELALRFGADDFGSVMFEENVVSSAGTTYCIDSSSIEKRIHAAGFRAVRRNVHYDWLTTPV